MTCKDLWCPSYRDDVHRSVASVAARECSFTRWPLSVYWVVPSMVLVPWKVSAVSYLGIMCASALVEKGLLYQLGSRYL